MSEQPPNDDDDKPTVIRTRSTQAATSVHAPTIATQRTESAPAPGGSHADDTLARATDRLRAGARVLTVTGYGGMGKTRFAIELFGRLEAEYPGGAAFISLASVTDVLEVLPTVSIALDVAEAPGRSALDAISTVIGERRVLLVLAVAAR